MQEKAALQEFSGFRAALLTNLRTTGGVLMAATALLTIALPLTNGTSPMVGLWIAGILVFACFLPARALLAGRDAGRVGAGDVVILVALGIAMLGTVAVLLRAYQHEPSLALAIMAAAGVASLFFPGPAVGWRREHDAGAGRVALDRVGALAITGLAVIPYFVANALMGVGPFSALFINVDNPYHLGQVASLLRDNAWPPQSLYVADLQVPYQYGIQQVAALLVGTTGIPHHAALFLVIGTCLGAALWMALYRLAICVPAAMPASVIALLAILIAPQLTIEGPIRLGHNLGLYSLLACAIAAISIANTDNDLGKRLLPAVIVTLTVVRIPFAIAIGVAYGTVQLIEAWRSRSLQPLIGPAIAAVVSAVVLLSLNYGSGGATLRPYLGALFEHVFVRGEHWPFYPDNIRNIPKWLIYNYGFFATAAVAVVAIAVTRSVPWRLLIFFLTPIVLLNVLKLQLAGYTRDADGSFSVAALMIMLHGSPVYLFAIAGVAVGQATAIRPQLRPAFAAAILLFGALPLGAQIFKIGALAANPSRGYEFVSNRALGDVLQQVPVENAMLVTNDNAHPANNYTRPDGNFPMGALFGHQLYAAGMRYNPPPDIRTRKDLNALLSAQEWSPEILDAARRLGWTHYVIRKAAPHPANIPLPLVAENDIYAVYRFPSSESNPAQNTDSNGIR